MSAMANNAQHLTKAATKVSSILFTIEIKTKTFLGIRGGAEEHFYIEIFLTRKLVTN